jgi:membrane protein
MSLIGQHLKSPSRPGWRATADGVRRQTRERNLGLLAAGTAFWAMLSIFPGVIATVTIYGIVASPDSVTRLVAKLGGSLSPSTRDVVTSWLAGITGSSHRGLGFGFVVGLAAVLWAVSTGVRTFIKAVTAAFEQDETRSFLRLRGLALLVSLGVIATAIVVFAAVGADPAIKHLVANRELRFGLDVGEWIVLALILAAVIAVLFRIAPTTAPESWRWASAGALFATVSVVLASIAFSLYVRFFAHYNKTYGALGGIVILMLWLYYCVYVVLLGALIDAEVEKHMIAERVESEQVGT